MMKTTIAISAMMRNALNVAKIPPAAVTASQMARIAPRIVPIFRPMDLVCSSAPLAGVPGVRRFVQISSMGAGQPPRPGTGEVWAAYIAAKTAAETDLHAWDLDWIILRPGSLTDASATGQIRLAPPPVPAGAVPRADVAAVIAALLDHPGTRHQTLELTSGDSPVATAVQRLS